jgi:hypothetical protein
MLPGPFPIGQVRKISADVIWEKKYLKGKRKRWKILKKNEERGKKRKKG